jgi:hypothetical protein
MGFLPLKIKFGFRACLPSLMDSVGPAGGLVHELLIALPQKLGPAKISFAVRVFITY